MTTQVKVTLKNGKVIHAVNDHMDPGYPARTNTPNDVVGGTYHLRTANGWLDIPATDVVSIVLDQGART